MFPGSWLLPLASPLLVQSACGAWPALQYALQGCGRYHRLSVVGRVEQTVSVDTKKTRKSRNRLLATSVSRCRRGCSWACQAGVIRRHGRRCSSGSLSRLRHTRAIRDEGLLCPRRCGCGLTGARSGWSRDLVAPWWRPSSVGVLGATATFLAKVSDNPKPKQRVSGRCVVAVSRCRGAVMPPPS